MSSSETVPASQLHRVQEEMEASLEENAKHIKSLSAIGEALYPLDTSLWPIKMKGGESNIAFRLRGVIASNEFFSSQVQGLINYIAKLEEIVGREKAHQIRASLEGQGENVTMYHAEAFMKELKEIRDLSNSDRATSQNNLRELTQKVDGNVQLVYEHADRLDTVESQLNEIDADTMVGQIDDLENAMGEKLEEEDIDDLRAKVSEVEERIKKLFPDSSKEVKLRDTIATMLGSKEEDESDEVFAARVLATIRKEDQDGKKS